MIRLPTPALLTKNHKKRVVDNFSKAAKTYNSAARLQSIVAKRTLLLLTNYNNNIHRIIDIGSGTGTETVHLLNRHSKASIIGLDISQEMLNYAKKNQVKGNIYWLRGDMDNLPLQTNSFQLAYSSLTIQWSQSINTLLAEVHRILKPGSLFAFSSLAYNSMIELTQAWKSVDNHQHINHYPTLQSQACTFRSNNFKLCCFTEKSEKIYYDDTPSLLRDLRNMGVNTLIANRQPGLMTPKKLNLLCDAYESIREPKGLPLTYQVIYGLVQKPHNSS